MSFLSINKHIVLFLYWIVQGTILTNLIKNERLCVGPIMLILALTIVILRHGHGSFEAKIMELSVQIQIPINKSKNILITKCIWIKGTEQKTPFHHNSETLNYASTHHDIMNGVWIMCNIIFHLVTTIASISSHFWCWCFITILFH